MCSRKAAKAAAKSCPSSGGGSRNRASSSAGVASRPTGSSGSAADCSASHARAAAPWAVRSAGPGVGSGSDSSRRRASGSTSVRVGLAVVLGEQGRLDVHATVVTGGLLGVAVDAVERAAVEELLQPRAVVLVEVDEVARQRLLVAAAVAAAQVVLGQKRRVVVVDALGDDAGAVAQRAGHAELGDDRLADEGALVGEL